MGIASAVASPWVGLGVAVHFCEAVLCLIARLGRFRSPSAYPIVRESTFSVK
jgi:hypothetical protein